MPIAVLNGAEDPFINLDYLDSISFKKLWRVNVREFPARGMRRSFRNLPCSMRS
jgi:hypothetical protein